MKEHILRELTNDLRDIARTFHDHDSLRERISHRLYAAFHDDAEWTRGMKEMLPQIPDGKLRKPVDYSFMTTLSKGEKP
jgi:hypothetical protein